MRNAVSLSDFESETFFASETTIPLLLAVADPALRRVLSTLFAAGGYAVTCATDGLEAQECLSRSRFPLVVAELELRQADGLALAAHAQQCDPYTECILLADADHVSFLLEACDTGLFYNHFWKPLHDVGDLIRSAGRALERRAMRLRQADLLTELRDTRTELRAFCSRLEQLDKVAALGQMTASVAGTLENPLASLSAYAQYLHARLDRNSGEPLTAEQIERVTDYLRDMEQGVSRCHHVVSNVLDYTRIHDEPAGPIPLQETLGEALDMLRDSLEAQGTRLRVEMMPSLPLVLANPRRLQQAVVNLVRNAQQAVEKGGVIGIFCELAEDRQRVEIRIEDDGPGIAPEVAERIFEPFFSTRPHSESLGLGLPIARSIVREWQGDLRVTSAPGRGTTATLLLPLSAEVAVPFTNVRHINLFDAPETFSDSRRAA